MFFTKYVVGGTKRIKFIGEIKCQDIFVQKFPNLRQMMSETTRYQLISRLTNDFFFFAKETSRAVSVLLVRLYSIKQELGITSKHAS